MSLITVGLTFTQKSARVYLVCETADKGLRMFSWRLCGRVVAVSGREERERAVELYFTTSMSAKQVVEHLGCPTGQCLERWLHADPRYADVVAKPSVPLGGGRRRAVGLCLSGMQRKQAAAELGAGAGAVHHWMRLCRAGGMAAPETGTDNARFVAHFG